MIRFRGFSKDYGALRAVDALTLDVVQGEVVALLGPNGSGKTTSVKAAAGLVRPSSGEVLLGEPPRSAAIPAARRILSYLPQRVAFPEAFTGREVVEFYRRLRGAPPGRTAEVLRSASLNGASDRPVGHYSGGMVQRLGLAVAQLAEAPVFLLDEPTAALDAEGLEVFYGVVEEARRQGRSVLFTSHQLGDAERLADRFAVLVGGRLAAVLGAAELRDHLAERGVMRVRLGGWPGGLIAAVGRLAPGTWRDGDELVVPGPSASRPAVLDAIRAAGAEICGLTAEEERLDTLYRELVEDHP